MKQNRNYMYQDSIMKTRKHLIFYILIFIITSCGLETKKKIVEHNYPKYWDKYTIQQLKDTLFSDTLSIGPDAAGGWTTRLFYIKTIKELITDLQDDKNEIDSLYPMNVFDKITIKKLPIGITKSFTNEQAIVLLEIINDPVSFNWAETTYQPEYEVDFLNNEKIVTTLTIGADKSMIKSSIGWPNYKKFKFGGLKKEARDKINKLLNEINNDK